MNHKDIHLELLRKIELNPECTQRELSQEMAETMKKVVGYKGKLIFDTTKPDGNPRKLIDITRLESMGWKYKTDLKAGLKETYKWYLNY